MTKTSAKSSLQSQIDENLRRVYEEALKEEVPERFKDLLAQLKAKEAAAKEPGK
ncbi:NepR family anti-sigma factor [Gemmobacter lanyuensis]|nr:NepR family anti-sigma factor [Gemmobacter lanyuensis]